MLHGVESVRSCHKRGRLLFCLSSLMFQKVDFSCIFVINGLWIDVDESHILTRMTLEPNRL